MSNNPWHHCDRCPHDLTVVHTFENGKYCGPVPIVSLSDEDLLDEYASECEGESRSISTDPPSPTENLREEILKRMSGKHPPE